MRIDIPAPITDTQHDLAPDVIVKLYRLELPSGPVFRLSPQIQVTWQTEVWDDVPCTLAEVEQDADGKMSRPKFTFANPGGLFTADIYNGLLDNAILTRYRILKANLDADQDFAITESFRVSRVLSLTNTVATVELRDVLDGHQFKLPARAYYPPEFPHVRLR